MSTTETDALSSTEKLNFSVKINKPSTCLRHVVVTVPRADVDRYFQKAFEELRPRAELPGFRPGKAPRKLIESRFKDHIAEQVKSSLLMDSLQQVTEGGEFSAISEPDLDYGAVEVPATGDFTYEFKIEVRPEFETPNWKGLTLNKPTFEITDSVVDTQLGRTLARFTSGEAVDAPAELGDTVLINIDFHHEGKLLSAIEENSVTLAPKLGLADCVIEDFGALLVGASEGEKKSTKAKISDQSSNVAMRGQLVDVEIELVEVRRLNVSDLGPSMLNELGFDNMDELKGFVREELTKQLGYHQQQSYRQQITNELTKDANWELPETLVRKQTSRELQRQALELRRSGFSDDQVGAYLNSARRNATDMTVKALREHFVLEKIAEDLKIEPTPEEYDAEIDLIAIQSDMSPRRIRARLERSGQMDALRNQIIERRVIETIAAEATVTEAKDDSFLTKSPTEAAIQHMVAPASEELPEAKYDEKPEDGAAPSATVKPTP